MDYNLWLRMAELRDPLVLDTPPAHFRLHGASKSGRVQRSNSTSSTAWPAAPLRGRRAQPGRAQAERGEDRRGVPGDVVAGMVTAGHFRQLTSVPLSVPALVGHWKGGANRLSNL
jgi:hypothetical protein